MRRRVRAPPREPAAARRRRWPDGSASPWRVARYGGSRRRSLLHRVPSPLTSTWVRSRAGTSVNSSVCEAPVERSRSRSIGANPCVKRAKGDTSRDAVPRIRPARVHRCRGQARQRRRISTGRAPQARPVCPGRSPTLRPLGLPAAGPAHAATPERQQSREGKSPHGFHPLKSRYDLCIIDDVGRKGRSIVTEYWWRRADSNRGPTDYETVALTS